MPPPCWKSGASRSVMWNSIFAVPFGMSESRISGESGSKQGAVPVQSTVNEKAKAGAGRSTAASSKNAEPILGRVMGDHPTSSAWIRSNRVCVLGLAKRYLRAPGNRDNFNDRLFLRIRLIEITDNRVKWNPPPRWRFYVYY